MFNPKITIIIPVYNWSNYLWEAIESALAQTYSNIEILVINDGSTDKWETEKIAFSFGDRINYIYKENWWVATALNLWIEKASWEYISWLSHDDLYYPNKIEEQVKVLEWLENKENKIIFNDYEFIDENKTIIKKIRNSIVKYNIFYQLITHKYIFNWCTLLIPKIAFKKAGLFDKSLKTTQDYNMWIRLIKLSYEFIHLPKILTKYRIHENQDSIKKKELFLNEIKDTQKYTFNIFTIDEIKEKSWLNSNKYIIYYYIKIIYFKNNMIWFITILTKKIWIYNIIAPIYRKLF